MRRAIVIGSIVAGVMLVAAGWVADRYFLPAGTVHIDEDAPAGVALREGALQGRAGHSASGTVSLVQDGERWLLHFTDLQMTAGPDIYLYVTPARDPTSSSQIDAGWRVPVVTAQDGSPRINERGTFSVELPAEVDIEVIAGLGVWCERFSVPFASAELVPAASA